MRPTVLRRCTLLVAAWFVAAAAQAQTVISGLDLTALSPEELGELNISAAAKRSEPLFDSPSAVSVLTSGEIAEYGFDSVADALRMIPGVEVTESSPYRWGIGIRGFDGFSSTKLLVLLDGRTVYSPFYGGVDWAEANMQIEDIEQVEVVRGPGATLWGANAVNGVINILSKDARDTQGGYISLRAGTADGIDTNLRYGGQIDDHAWYRAYVTYTDTRDAPEEADADGDHYAFRQVRAGFRVDDDASSDVHLTLQGEVTDLQHWEYTPDAATGQELDNGDSHRPEYILGRLRWAAGDDNTLTVQVYADGSPDSATPGAYTIPGGIGAFGIVDRGHDFDVDITDSAKLGPLNDLVWGGGYRWTQIDLVDSNPAVISVQEPMYSQDLYNFFAQDEFTLVPSRLQLTLGTKVEHDEYIAWQALPSARLTFTPDDFQTFWVSASRAIRSPSRSERDIHLDFAYIPSNGYVPPVLVALNGSAAFHQEDLNAFEAGWRQRWGSAFSVDFAGYYNHYTQLRSVAPSEAFQASPPLIIENFTADNAGNARGYGVEGSANWRINPKWNVSATFTDERLMAAGEPFPEIFAPDFALPHEMASLRSAFNLAFDLQLSAAAYYVGPLLLSEYGEPDIAGYTRFDAQLTWWVRTDLELNLGVQNAFDRGHFEASAVSFFPQTEIPRNFFAQLQWRY